MNPATDHIPEAPGRSWRQIRQEVKPVAMSRQGRRRRLAGWARAAALAVTIAGAGWGLYTVAHSWSTNRAELATAMHSELVREIRLSNPHGVLTREWAAQVLGLPRTASLLALDLPVLRDRLLAHGQVQAAVLAREFPGTLAITLQERAPVARVQADDGQGQPKQFLVANDGVVYEGLNYDKAMLAGLPWLDGVRLVKSGRGFAPITGMAEVSALLSTAQLQAPHLYREWLVVSLARLAEQDEIIVKSQEVPEIVFSRKRDYFKQLAQLDYIVDAAHGLAAAPPLQSVNLSFEGQVPVRLLAAPAGPAAAARPFSLQLSQRKTPREL